METINGGEVNEGGIRLICLKDEDGHKSRGKQS